MPSSELPEDGQARLRLARSPDGGRRGRLRAGFRIPALAVAGIATLVLSCGDDATGPTTPPPPPPAPVATTVTVNPGSASFTALGDTARFTAEVRDQNGQVMAGATVAWESSDASVATADASGQVTAAGNGTATITASAGPASGTAEVTVAQQASAVSVSPAEATLVAFGDTVRLTAEATDANGHAVAGLDISWSSSDEDVARVDDTGLVEAVAEGTATITVTAGSAFGTASVTVMENLDRAALVALYEATDGPNWHRNDNWLTEAPLEEWYGIETYSGNTNRGRVSKVDLQDNNLIGSIPREFRHLVHLTWLFLYGNEIADVSALGSLTKLQDLDLTANRLTDVSALAGLTSLERLRIGQNRITDISPLAGLTNLTSLRVGDADIQDFSPLAVSPT